MSDSELSVQDLYDFYVSEGLVINTFIREMCDEYLPLYQDIEWRQEWGYGKRDDFCKCIYISFYEIRHKYGSLAEVDKYREYIEELCERDYYPALSKRAKAYFAEWSPAFKNDEDLAELDFLECMTHGIYPVYEAVALGDIYKYYDQGEKSNENLLKAYAYYAIASHYDDVNANYNMHCLLCEHDIIPCDPNTQYSYLKKAKKRAAKYYFKGQLDIIYPIILSHEALFLDNEWVHGNLSEAALKEEYRNVMNCLLQAILLEVEMSSLLKDVVPGQNYSAAYTMGDIMKLAKNTSIYEDPRFEELKTLPPIKWGENRMRHSNVVEFSKDRFVELEDVYTIEVMSFNSNAEIYCESQKQGDGTWRHTTKLVEPGYKSFDKSKDNYFLLSVPKCGFCNFVDEIVFTSDENTKIFKDNVEQKDYCETKFKDADALFTFLYGASFSWMVDYGGPYPPFASVYNLSPSVKLPYYEFNGKCKVDLKQTNVVRDVFVRDEFDVSTSLSRELLFEKWKIEANIPIDLDDFHYFLE
ncbi:MAG: hypothetical protein MJ189_02585 [Coriobacteriales bacterium]|nr:hypothetical protein [Coriobacteriales bacterium]